MAIDDYQHADYKQTDDRGRVTLGKEYADSTVAIAWTEIDRPSPPNVDKPPQEVRDKLTELHSWASENDYTVLDYDEVDGRVYTASAEWVDTPVEGLGND